MLKTPWNSQLFKWNVDLYLDEYYKEGSRLFILLLSYEEDSKTPLVAVELNNRDFLLQY